MERRDRALSPPAGSRLEKLLNWDPWAGLRSLPIFRNHRALWFWLLPVILGTISLGWLQPFADFLYGSDSYHFVQPFSYNFSSLIQYGYTFNPSSPATDTASTYFAQLFVLPFNSAGVPIPDAERLAVILVAILGIVGLFRLFGTLNELNGRPREAGLPSMTVASLLYLMNPFSLSFIWWHFQFFALLYAYLPFLVALFLRAAYRARVGVLETAMTVLVGLVLAPGITQGLAVVVGYVALFFSLVLLVRFFRSSVSGRFLLRRMAVIWTVTIALLGWLVIPFAVIPRATYTTTTFVTPTNLSQVFASQNQYATSGNVLRLVAFNWLYQSPSAFAWIAYLPVLAAFAWLIPAVFLLAASFYRRVSGLLAVAGLAVIPLVLSMAGSWPISALDSRLLGVGGPFLILTGAFYYLIELYVLAFAAVCFVLLQGRSRWREPSPPGPASKSEDEPGQSSEGRAPSAPRGARRAWGNRWPTVGRAALVVSVAAILVMLAVFCVPFVTANVYQTAGDNVDAFPIPPSYSTLGNLLAQNYSGPDYYVLVLPLSLLPGSQQIRVDGGSFDDSTFLLAAYIPYPVLWCNNSEVAADLGNYLTSGEALSLQPVLSALHVRYVVIDPFADNTSYIMTHSSNGVAWNMTYLEDALDESLGPATGAGQFQVFVNRDAVPLVSALPNRSAIAVPSFGAYLSALGSVDEAESPWLPYLTYSPWTPTPIPGTEGGSIYSLSVARAEIPVTPSGEILLINSSGQVVSGNASYLGGRTPGLDYSAANDSLVLNAPLVVSSKSSQNVTTDMAAQGGDYVSTLNRTNFLSLRPVIPVPSIVSLDVAVRALSPANSIELNLNSSGYRFQARLELSPGAEQDSLWLTAYNTRGAYFWDDRAIPTLLPSDNVTLNLTVEASQVLAAAVGSGFAQPAALSLNLSLSATPSPGDNRNDSNPPPSSFELSNYTAGLVTDGPQVAVTSLAVYDRLPLEWAIVTNRTAPLVPYSTSVSADSLGNLHATVSGVPSGTPVYVLLGFPPNSLWGASAPGGSVQTLSGGPYSMVFAVTSSSSSGTLAVDLVFNVQVTTGLYVGIGETAATAAVVVALMALRLRRAYRRP